MEKKRTFTITSESSSGNTRILLQGRLVIGNAAEIKKILITAINACQNLTLVLNDIIKIDVAVLQLLIALQKTAGKLQKNLFFDFGTTSYVKTVLQHSGLEKTFATNFNPPLNGIH